jgi:pimeloyl-ACP methyl ester carboxylesterase
MFSRGRLPTALLAVAALAVPLMVVESPAAAAPPAIAWSPCPEDATAECGTLRVPLDWTDPRGPTVDLAVARRRATDPTARIGSLQVNPGGPGGLAREMAIFGYEQFSPEIRRRFDIVGMDPRGVGASDPVLCSTDLVNASPPFAVDTAAEYAERVAFNARLRADCRAHTGPLYDHVDMLSVVRDMDALRAALGDEKLTYYGVSYGSLNAQQYAELFPHRVRAIVSDSNLDHSLDTRRWLETEAASAQDSFDEFVKWNDRTPSSALHGRDVRAVWHRLLERVAAGEFLNPWQPSRRMRPYDLVSRAFVGFYFPDWAGLAQSLSDMDAGIGPDPVPPLPQEPETALPHYAIFCNDWSLPVRDYGEYTEHRRRLARIAPDMWYGPPALAFVEGCLGSPKRISNPQHRLRLRGLDTPLLLVNALHDPATGYNRALGVARQAGRDAVLLTYEGWGHGAYGRGACVDAAVDRYLLTRQPPARGTHCPGIEPTTSTALRSGWPTMPAFPYR